MWSSGTHAREQVERGHGRFVDFLEIAAPRIVGRRLGEQDLGEPEDDAQLILEVVTVLVVCHRSALFRASCGRRAAARSPREVPLA